MSPSHGSQPSRKLPVDLKDLAFAMEQAEPGGGHVFDVDTGAVIMFTDDDNDNYEQLCAELGDVPDEEWEAAFEAALAEHGFADWEKDIMRETDRVERGFGTRLVRVPTVESRAGYQDMSDFIETVRDRRVAERLGRALGGSHPFRRFKDTLLDAPQERERWFAFKDARSRERAIEWLASIGIEPASGQ